MINYVIHNLESAAIFEGRLWDGYWSDLKDVHFSLSEIVSGCDKFEDVKAAAAKAIGLQAWDTGIFRGHDVTCRVISKLDDRLLLSQHGCKTVRLTTKRLGKEFFE